MIQGT